MPVIALRHRVRAGILGALGLALLVLLFALPGHASAVALLFALPLVFLPLGIWKSHQDAVRDELAREAMKRHYAREHPARP